MSKSLWLDYEFIDQPASQNPMERKTWCQLRIRIGDRFVSRVWDRSTKAERTTLYVPAFPIAEWLVSNWWFLWNEGQRPSDPWNWAQRHCFRAADAALLLPKLSVFHDGKCQRVQWEADPEGSRPHMPAEFCGGAGDEVLDADQCRMTLSQFIDDTLARVRDLGDDRVRDLHSLWQAIRSAGQDESDFCRLAGRFGVDPYNRKEMTDDLATFLEKEFKTVDYPLVTDLIDVSHPQTISQQWEWITRTNAELGMGPHRSESNVAIPVRGTSPPTFGYELARTIRKVVGLSDETPVDSVENLSRPILNKTFRVVDRNHLFGTGIKSLIGQTLSGEIISAGPHALRADNRRFLVARGLCHAIANTRSSQRLVTEAFSWDQQASRAFAAELLIPQEAIKNRISRSVADQSLIEVLASEYVVSTLVVERQLQNMRITISED